MIPIAILASGRGSNFDAILNAIRAKKLDAQIVAVISDRADAGVLAKAQVAGVKAVVVPFPTTGKSLVEKRQEHERLLLKELHHFSPRFLVMAGYMRIVTPDLIQAFKSERGYSRIVNIHPSLLPSFPGVNGYAQAFSYGVKITGVTVHLVDHDLDQGPICAQESFLIDDCKSVEEVEQRGLAVEHRLFPQTLKWVLPEKFQVQSRASGVVGRLCVQPD